MDHSILKTINFGLQKRMTLGRIFIMEKHFKTIDIKCFIKILGIFLQKDQRYHMFIIIEQNVSILYTF